MSQSNVKLSVIDRQIKKLIFQKEVEVGEDSAWRARVDRQYENSQTTASKFWELAITTT